MGTQVNIALQRRTYAMSRLQRAMARLVVARDAGERVVARRWVNAWSGAIGEAHFDDAVRAISLAYRLHSHDISHG